MNGKPLLVTAKALLTLVAALSLFALASAPASASEHPLDFEWVAPTNEGGEIRLTFRICDDSADPKKVTFEAYIVANGGRMIHGCWKPVPSEIEVVWRHPINAMFRYKAANFTKRSLK